LKVKKQFLFILVIPSFDTLSIFKENSTCYGFRLSL